MIFADIFVYNVVIARFLISDNGLWIFCFKLSSTLEMDYILITVCSIVIFIFLFLFIFKV